MRIQRYALLHDADEAFGIPDFITPVKKRFPAVKTAQKKLGAAVEERFDLDPATYDIVKAADRQALYLERRAAKNRKHEARWLEWLGNAEVPEGISIVPLPPAEAHALFLEAYDRVFDRDLPITREWMAVQDGFEVELAEPVASP
ncbi:hypothetical protein GE300_20045 [Rhodobacteraceae bacterium 2CG4]|uniref:Uncharacterized protein n=2 Tax=Halovulum marinum TaxID=2662447 RepID=A0A6L5Z6X3_9RHOB|nr:hypothetical protein [Halovulum marinum]